MYLEKINNIHLVGWFMRSFLPFLNKIIVINTNVDSKSLQKCENVVFLEVIFAQNSYKLLQDFGPNTR